MSLNLTGFNVLVHSSGEPSGHCQNKNMLRFLFIFLDNQRQINGTLEQLIKNILLTEVYKLCKQICVHFI